MTRDKYRESEYYNKLYELFIEYGLLDYDIIDEKNIQNKYKESFIDNCEDLILYEKCLNDFGFDIENRKFEHYRKYKMWNIEFCKEKQSDLYVNAAINFCLFCCLIDNVLDIGNYEITSDYALELINWEKVEKYFDGQIYDKELDFNTLDYLLKNISKDFAFLKKQDAEKHSEILYYVKEALNSEVFMEIHKMNEENFEIEIDMLTNKSIKFVLACYEIASFNSNEREKTKICGKTVAEIYWLIDDLCDLYDDIKNNRMNSILQIHLNALKNYNLAINNLIYSLNIYVEKLSNKLNRLEELVNQQLFKYIKSQICLWSECIISKL